MDKESLEVVEHVTAYFKKYLPGDTVLGVGRKSHHPDETHLYLVLSKKENNGYVFCDCWDEKKKILTRGRYGIELLDSFVRILNKDQGKPTYYAVYYSYDDKVKNPLFITEDESKARKFCEHYEWEYEDEYGVYQLFYEMIYTATGTQTGKRLKDSE